AQLVLDGGADAVQHAPAVRGVQQPEEVEPRQCGRLQIAREGARHPCPELIPPDLGDLVDLATSWPGFGVGDLDEALGEEFVYGPLDAPRAGAVEERDAGLEALDQVVEALREEV